MSLFSRIQPANQQQPAQSSGTGLFGSTPQPATSSAGGGLFGSTATSQPATTSSGGGGLFGATASSAPKPGGLFGGGGGASQPPAGNLFGGAGAASTAAPAGSSLFGGKSAQGQNNTQGTGAGSSIFGSNDKNDASLFQSGGLLSRQSEQSLSAAAPDSNAPQPQPAYFDALLQRGKKRQTEDGAGAFGELPQLQLGLQDISRKVRNLGQGGPSAGLARGGDARAHYLLSASGVNTGNALRDLEDLAGSTANRNQAPTDPGELTGNGVKDTLAQKYQNDFQNMVNAHVRKSKEDFNKMIDEKLHGVDWDSHRQRIYEHFGLRKPSNLGDSTADGAFDSVSGSFGRSSRRGRQGASTLEKSYGLPGMARSVIGTPGPMAARKSVFGDVADKMPVDGVRTANDDRVLRVKQEHYADRVKDLNVARLQEKVYPLLKKFSEVEAEPSNDDNTNLVNAYKALIRITGENADVQSMADPGAVKERAYASAYLDDNVHSQASSKMRKRILDGSRRFLEELYFSEVESTVARSPREANVGGVPTPLAKIKGYVRVKAFRKELGSDIDILQNLHGDYCWPVIFFMFRSGLYKEALQYIEENSAAFRQIDRSFVRYLRAYVASDDRRLPNDLQTSLNNEYSARSRLAPEDSIDPFRTACYKIIGRCDLQKRSLEGFTTEMRDWLWLQFALAREYTRVDEFAHEAFGLDELRATIREIAERYFGPTSEIADAPSMLFFMQTLAGMFEKAVTDLYPQNYISANHFAVAMDYYGLLRVSDMANSEDLLSFTTQKQPQLAFGSMVGLYTRDFRTANPTAAVDYLALICLNGDLQGELGRKQRELCHQALTEVVLETREFAQLLGDIRADGQRIKGAIEQRLKLIGLDDERDFLKHITLVAARTAEEQSRVTDAALCFHLAEDYDKVIQVVNEAVSLSLTTELGEEPAKLTPLKPRNADEQQAVQAQQQPQMTSLSLTAVDDPVDLAMNMRQLYASSQMYYSKIKEVNRDSCEVLLKLADARRALEQGNWAMAVDVSASNLHCQEITADSLALQRITSSRLLPTAASGDLPTIRTSATAFNSLPTVVARTVGYAMLWTVLACSRNVEKLKHADFDTPAQRQVVDRSVQTAKDTMVFAGLIRYKLPGRVWEGLARVGGEVGAY